MNYTLMPTLEDMAHVQIATLLWNHDDIRNCLTSKVFKSYSFSEDGMDPHTAWESNSWDADMEWMPKSKKSRVLMTEYMEEFMFDDPTMAKYDGGYDPYISKEDIDEYDKMHYGDPEKEKRDRISGWQKIENKVMEKAFRMSLSESLKVKVASCIKPIGLEILKWIQNHVEVEYLAIKLPSEFCWTPYGAIDKKKTAEAIIRDEKMHITKHFKLACIYCLENDVKRLWNEIPKDHIMFEPEEFVVFEDYFEHKEMIDIWYCILRGKIENLLHKSENSTHTPFQYAFQCSVEYGYKAAAEYFFHKLTPEEQEKSLLRAAGCVIEKLGEDDTKGDHADVLHFLLSQMDNQQLEEVFKAFSSTVLQCFLDWPWQGSFLKAANRALDFLSRYEIESIVYKCLRKEIDGYKDCNYRKLFYEFFKLIPRSQKKYFDKKCFEDEILLLYPFSLLPDLFDVKDKEIISFILKDATDVEKDILFQTRQGKDICVALACNNEWDLLEFFFTECISSQEKLMQVRERFKEHEWYYAGKRNRTEVQISFFRFFDNLVLKKQNEGTAE